MRTRWMGLVAGIALLVGTHAVSFAQSLVGVHANKFVRTGEQVFVSVIGRAITHLGGNLGSDGTEAGVQAPFAYSATAKNLVVQLRTAVPSGGAVSVTLRVNGSDSTLSVLMTGPLAPGVYGNVVNTVAITQGDLVSMKITNTLASTILIGGISFEYGP